jgi:methylenetetrahydrofolate reductase (NADPH)
MSFVERLGKEFVVTGEVEPEAAVSDSFRKKAKAYRPYTRNINVIDSPLGMPQVSSLAASLRLKEEGFSPVLQMCARDRNKTAIVNDLLGANLLGLEDVLAISGDYPKESKPVYEFDSVSLLRLIKKEMPRQYKGFSMNAGAAYNPMAQPNEPEQIKLKKKLKYADFIQTQMVFDPEQLDSKIVQANKDRIIVGILPLLPGYADYFNKNIPGVSISREIADRIKSKNDGIKLANDVARNVKEQGFAGIHLMVFEVEDRLGEILEGVI